MNIYFIWLFVYFLIIRLTYIALYVCVCVCVRVCVCVCINTALLRTVRPVFYFLFFFVDGCCGAKLATQSLVLVFFFTSVCVCMPRVLLLVIPPLIWVRAAVGAPSPVRPSILVPEQ